MTRMIRAIGLLKTPASLAVVLLATACNGTSGDSAGPSTSPASVPTPATMLAFSASSYAMQQSAQSVAVTVQRTGTGTGAVSVSYATADGTAKSGADYTAAHGTLQWAENDSTDKSITVLVNPAAFSGQRTFAITLSDPSSDAQIASPGSATVTISGMASASVGTLELSDAAYAVQQSAGSVTVTVNRSGGAVGAIAVRYATADGTAAAGRDYTAASGTLQWADGDATPKSFSVAVSKATAFTGTRAFGVALSGASGGAMLGTPASATVTISGDASPPAGSVQLGASGYSVAQNAGTLQVSVERVGGSSGAATVFFATASGSALAGRDFTAASGTLNWADGDSSAKSFMVAVSNATPFAGSRTFTVALSNPSAGISISNPGSATVVISGDAAPAVGSLQLTAPGYAIGQAGGALSVAVSRTGGSSGPVSVTYSTVAGTAVAGSDYTSASGTLSWADGDTANKTFTVAISNLTPFSGTRSFSIKLAGATGGAALGSPSSALATITGDAAVVTPGSLQLSASAYSVPQSGGHLTVTVNRTGGSGGAVAVSYATANGSAIAGTDYTAASGTLSWPDGDASSKTFSVAVSNATPFSGSKAFTLALSGPSGNATLSAPSTATVTISGSGASPGNVFWIYHDGTFSWGGDYSTAAVPDYSSTAGAPESGPYDISITLTGQWGIWAPYAGGTVPMWDFDATGYKYITMDLRPTVSNQQWQFYFMQVGDVPIIGPNGQQTMVNLADYGPAPVAGQWATYKIPLSVVLTQYSSGSPVYETHVYKFGLQDQTGLSKNVWYLDNVGFTTQ